MVSLRTAAAAMLAATLLAVVLPDAAQAQRTLLNKGGKHDDEKHGKGHESGPSNPPMERKKFPKHAPIRKAGPGKPYNIAHRGSCGELPEETREDWVQAIELGADFIEGDCVLTKDGHLVMRHEPNLSNTTNANDLFPDRIKTYYIDFQPSTGVHAIDLTLKEVRQLRARQRLFFRDQSYNDQFKILTLQEYLEVALSAPRTVGVYPETKHPAWHDSFRKLRPELGRKTMTQRYIEIIKSYGYGGRINSKRWLQQPIYLQSFEVKNLKYLRTVTDLPLVQLLSSGTSPVPDLGQGTITPTSPPTEYKPDVLYSAIFDAQGLRKTAKYANGLGPDKGLILINDQAGKTTNAVSDLIPRAHALGLQVQPYTFRNEKVFFADNLSGIFQEYQLALDAGVDGLFTDYTEGFKFFLRQAKYHGPRG